MLNLKLSALLVIAVFLTACDSSSSSSSGSGGSGGGSGTDVAVSALFSASADAEPLALDLINLPSSLEETFGAANDEPVAVSASEGIAGLITE